MNYKVLIGFWDNRPSTESVLYEMIQKGFPGAIREHDGRYSILVGEYSEKKDAQDCRDNLINYGFLASVSYE